MKFVVGLLAAGLCCLDTSAGNASYVIESGVVAAPGFHFDISQTVFAPVLWGGAIDQPSNQDGFTQNQPSPVQPGVTLTSSDYADTGSFATDVTAMVVDTLVFPVASAVPEPSTWAMMILGFCALGFVAYRRKSVRGLSAV